MPYLVSHTPAASTKQKSFNGIRRTKDGMLYLTSVNPNLGNETIEVSKARREEKRRKSEKHRVLISPSWAGIHFLSSISLFADDEAHTYHTTTMAVLARLDRVRLRVRH